MITAKTAAMLIVSCAIGCARGLGYTDEAFQAVAHIWVGGLFGAGLIGRHRDSLAAAVGLSLLEIFCFLAGVGR